MATIKIGSKVCSFQGSPTILQVAMANDVHIPYYCYHPGLSIVAICRICLAEVSLPNPKTGNLERVPKLVPTCQQPAVDGAEVHLESEKTLASQKSVMEYLLINHPLDCPVCDQAGECYLQDYSYLHGRATSRFEETKVKHPKKDIGPHVLLYSDRCIMCSRCVRFTREVSGTGELAVVQRGNKSEIDIFPGRPLDNPLSGNVVDICPVGALLDKDFLFEQRVWYLKSVPVIDPLTASGDNLWADHNEGKIWRLRPRENPEVNKFWTSDEIRYGWKYIHSEARLSGLRQGSNGSSTLLNWDLAYARALAGLGKSVAEGKRIALVVSPFLPCEEAWLLATLALALDGKALLAVGPVPHSGPDQTFTGGYTIYAEKAPNARGVKRALQLASGRAPVEFEAFAKTLAADTTGASIGAVILTGNAPDPSWVAAIGESSLAGRFLVYLETLANPLTAKADLLLPTATWAEKSGTFENVKNRLQAFEQALTPLEGTRTEGQIALDLLAAAGKATAQRYEAPAIRQRMGGAFTTDIHTPSTKEIRQPDMAFVEF